MFDSQWGFDQPLNELYDDILAIQRSATEYERDYRELAARDDIAVDGLGVETTPAECIAIIAESLAQMQRLLDDVEDQRATAQRAAARLFIDPS